jgi:hypothetical protein
VKLTLVDHGVVAPLTARDAATSQGMPLLRLPPWPATTSAMSAPPPPPPRLPQPAGQHRGESVGAP